MAIQTPVSMDLVVRYAVHMLVSMMTFAFATRVLFSL